MNNNCLNSYFTVAFLALFSCCVNAQSHTEKIDELMSRYTEYHQFNGSVLVAEKGEVIHKKGYGWANMEWGIANSYDTKHRLGSITKQFTAVLVLQSVEKGKIHLDSSVSHYLDYYPKENGSKITIHHLLTHTSGLPNYTSFPGFIKDKSREPYTPKEFIKIFSELELEFAPGEKYAYSNSGYFLLGVILEKVSSKSYEQLLHENIFDPLHMTNSGFDHHNTILKKRATGYVKTGYKTYENSPYIDMSIPYSAGSMYSTAEDLYKWDQALYNGIVLSKASLNLMFTPHVAVGSGNYGYGWDVRELKLTKKSKPKSVVMHGGGINGFSTVITRITTDKHLIVILNNTGGVDLFGMVKNISLILYDEEYQLPKRSIAYEYLDLITTEGLETALAKFEKMQELDEYHLDESELNNVGYTLLSKKMMDEAIETFKLNVEAFPKSANVYDSLGEAYLANGNEELALKYYQKTLKLNSDNPNAKKIVEELESKTTE